MGYFIVRLTHGSPSNTRVMDMEHELQALRVQLAEKCKYSIQLQKELARKIGEETVSQLYELDGMEALGSFLQIQPCSLSASELSECSIQWYRLACEGGKQEPISDCRSTWLQVYEIENT
ncbi:hypothetical protein T459_27973 [Capsicum annuum]|uniref:Uncharacterized protein n=1 Tax=Capsicum annuum TaxID=4072 RepID=A0A2G2YFG5_CAPAN|nr:hypothetical protein T459_27973 [Capsicum annuum]